MRTTIDYAKEFAACEAEELRVTGQVQAGLSVLAIAEDGALSGTPDMVGMPTADIQALASAKSVHRIGARHDFITGPDGRSWIRHHHNGHTILERPKQSTAHTDLPELDWEKLTQSARGNLWKLSYAICKEAEAVLKTDRAMVYRFHHDWTGEVISEVISDGHEPFLGLHYPPTDIPKQARALYLETKSRQIFSTHRMDTPLHTVGDTAEPVDLTHAIGRSCSPYHIEYLRNMGSVSTASCALVHEGELWGLMSLHFAREREPSLAEFSFLQSTADGFGAALADVLEVEQQERVRRANRLKTEFSKVLDRTSDPFNALVLSRSALHRMLGASGICLLLGDEVCQVGHVPDVSVTDDIVAALGTKLDPMTTAFSDSLPDAVSKEGHNGIAGVSITKITNEPPSFVLTFRKSQEQSVSWGGDPRRVSQDDETHRVSPRRSFEQWVERVTGHSAPWTQAQRDTLAETLAHLSAYFGANDRELALLIKNGLRQAARQKENVRANAVDLIDGMKTAIAVCVETAGDEHAQIVALNAAASDAFAVSPAEVGTLGSDTLERLTGVDLKGLSEGQFTATLATANAGIRECEISVGLIFEYFRRDQIDAASRIQVFEFRDVTEARRIEQALTAARDRARTDMKLRQEFFAKLAHELKTPLNALVGLSSLLETESAKFDERTAKRIGMLATASKYMSELVESTLQSAMTAQSIDNDSFSAVDLEHVAQECIAFLNPLLDEKTVRVQLALDTTAPAYGDKRGIRQIILNILSNAIKYNVPNGQVMVSMTEDRDHVALSITDTGQGMTDKQVTECIEPYKRFSTTDGAGLGLSITNHLISLMGGVMTMSSEVGVGTQVKLLFPKPSETAAPSQIGSRAGLG